MIDVHAPHESTHTWTDFFIHIATIAVGLLIAIGLEQTVELIHHRHQLADARQQLAAERDLNREVLEKNLRSVASMQAQLDRDVSILNQHLASPGTPLSAPLNYSWMLYRTPDGAWQAVRASGSLALMSPAELRSNTYRYEVLETLTNAFHDFQRSVEVAGAIARRSPSATPDPQTTQELLSATSTAQGSLAVVQRFLGIESTRALDDPAAASSPRPLEKPDDETLNRDR
jgi:uncharacterized membrane-anchored protein YhcB (DUF1043 family)